MFEDDQTEAIDKHAGKTLINWEIKIVPSILVLRNGRTLNE